LALDRLEGLFPPERVFIVTGAEYGEQVRQCFPLLPGENVIGEPMGRDTANAIALGAERIAALDEDATMAVFTADHIIRPKEEFAECVQHALEAAENDPEALVTFGIRPNMPHTGLGYVHFGETLYDGVHKVHGFKEKPDRRTARYYVESGQYFWNSGMFVWKVQTIRQQIRQHLPASAESFEKVGEAYRSGADVDAVLKRVYPDLPKISIDFAVMEKAPHVLMVELTCQWLDVGSWPALADVVEADEDGNTVVAPRAALLDSNRNIVFSDDNHLLAIFGMDDCIVVHTADATLVCNKSDSQRLKELVDWVGQHFGSRYL